MSDPTYAAEAQQWYQEGYTYGYNQMEQVWMDGGPTGVVAITEPITVPPQWQSVYMQGMVSGETECGNQWSNA